MSISVVAWIDICVLVRLFGWGTVSFRPISICLSTTTVFGSILSVCGLFNCWVVG